MRTTLTGAGLLAGALLLGGGAAQAALIDYTAGGVNLVWDNDYGATGLTWLKNANLADTVDFGVSGIAANGTMTWDVAQSWITAMNAANYAGTNGWRLWSALNSDGSGPCSGYNCTGSELGHLFYTEGGLTSGQAITSSTVLTQHFTYMQSSVYWSGTQFAPNPSNAWFFYPASGSRTTTARATRSTVGPCAPDKSPPPRYPRRAC
ncbi:DUF1566 domain-containing protein [Candidatus Thiodictyon syntrophicum]|uniref:DUF1566 domain-containing protein n=1 Tax=Candidatus Thiodictyon syntrophicum TaxID=1166950 RepID=A0A2K8UD98_9GAMM|nr:DUF1566 domain-containing protein [Candidatus Thiodictyon syntrophicum]AUB83564.1 hypothetical protein THSYN_23205 [Candidatus Thiodictyon syntrophicum]